MDLGYVYMDLPYGYKERKNGDWVLCVGNEYKRVKGTGACVCLRWRAGGVIHVKLVHLVVGVRGG